MSFITRRGDISPNFAFYDFKQCVSRLQQRIIQAILVLESKESIPAINVTYIDIYGIRRQLSVPALFTVEQLCEKLVSFSGIVYVFI